nr:hypothetical protein [Streptomyces antibioticus]
MEPSWGSLSPKAGEKSTPKLIAYRVLGGAAKAEDVVNVASRPASADRIPRLSPVDVRETVSRAREHLTDDQRDSVDGTEHRKRLDAFVAAARRPVRGQGDSSGAVCRG